MDIFSPGVRSRLTGQCPTQYAPEGNDKRFTTMKTTNRERNLFTFRHFENNTEQTQDLPVTPLLHSRKLSMH